jgi:hypothetical protein
MNYHCLKCGEPLTPDYAAMADLCVACWIESEPRQLSSRMQSDEVGAQGSVSAFEIRCNERNAWHL